MSPELQSAIDRAVAAYGAMSYEERCAMKKAQRKSFIRAMTTPCEHGVLDFEQCGDCIAEAQKRIAATARHSSG